MREEKRETDAEILKKWPGVDHAYEFVIPSYNWLLARFEAANNRIQTMQAFAASITLAIPITARSLNPDIAFQDWRFLLAVCLAGAVVVVGVIGRQSGNLALVNPAKLWASSLSWGSAEFKKNAIYWAGENFNANNTAIANKWKLANWMMALFCVELLMFLAWVVVSQT